MTENLIQASQGRPWSDWNRSAHLARAGWIEPEALCAPGRRTVVVAPHPDDEILMAGGLMAGFEGREQDLVLVSATDGEGSHPGSEQWPPSTLRRQRVQESRHALQRLKLDLNALTWERLNLTDGGVAHDEAYLVNHLTRLLAPGDLLITTWRGDGHCDHEAIGRACAQAAAARQATLCEIPVWAWHWAEPDDPRLPWSRARRVRLDPQRLARKREAIDAHVTQLQPDGDRPPVVPPLLLDCLLQPFELVFL